MPATPRSGRKAWKALDCDIGKFGKNRCEIVAGVRLQNAFELSQERLRSIASTA
jgi:hypothetical protein